MSQLSQLSQLLSQPLLTWPLLSRPQRKPSAASVWKRYRLPPSLERRRCAWFAAVTSTASAVTRTGRSKVAFKGAPSAVLPCPAATKSVFPEGCVPVYLNGPLDLVWTIEEMISHLCACCRISSIEHGPWCTECHAVRYCSEECRHLDSDRTSKHAVTATNFYRQ